MTPMRSRPLANDVGAMAFVQAAQLCHGLSAEALGPLFEAGQVCEYEPGQTVVEEGSVGGELFMVYDGQVRVQKRHGDGTVELAALQRPAVFGEISLLTGRPRSATVIASVDAQLIRFPAETVRHMADTWPLFGRRLAALMAGRTRDTEHKLGT